MNAATIETIVQVIPSDKNEQLAMSVVLTDFDTDIYNLEKQLNKTKSIKQGIMQELLTGKTRLINFKGGQS